MRAMVANWPLIGRREELSIIDRTLGDRQFRGLLLAGAPGVGKTRLAREALASAGAQGCFTGWAAASRAVAAIPFGAMAHLLPPAGDSSIHLQVLRQAGEWLASQAGGRRVVIGVDDWHLLDDASAALVYHLAVTGVAFVVVTLRTGEPAPEPVTALWKDGAAERLEIQALARAEVGELIEAALNAPVDGLTKEQLWQLSHGNILYLRELVRGGRQTGALTCVEGIWHWAGSVSAPPQLVELIQARIGGLPAAVRVVGELVAFGEPLEIGVLTRAGASAADVEAAERAGLLVTELAGPDLRVRLGHPLFGEVIRAQTLRLRRRTVHAMLADAAGPVDGLRPEDVLRIAVWHLEAGTRSEPGLLVAAAGWALAALNYRLAERLCRAAADSGGGWSAQRLLAQALVGQGQAGLAEELLVGQMMQARTDAERAEVAGVRALNLFWGLGRPGPAEAVLDQAATCIEEPAQRAGLVALRGRFLLHAGRSPQALAILDAVPDDPHVPKTVALEAMVTATMALVACGRYDEAIATATRGLRLGRQSRGGGCLLALDELAATQATAYLRSGQLAAAAALAETGYQRALDARSPLSVAIWALVRGGVAEARGAMVTASGWMREVIGVVGGPARLHPYQGFITRVGLDALARSTAIAGDLDCAQTALTQADALTGPAMRLFDTWSGPVQAWVAAARGEVPAAVELALSTAAQAERCGQAGCALIALYDVARLGAPARVAVRLVELATVVPGDLAPLFASHVQALLAADGTALDKVAARFAALGINLLAAEAATAAACAHRRAGRTGSAAASAVRAAALAAVCEGARTPALTRLDEPVGLTPRELEIARLAASGLSSRAIAAQLVVAVRTVDNALGQVYAKLGIGRRDELAPIFTVPASLPVSLSGPLTPAAHVPSQIG
ncbi:MAG: LuxR C-terminal-related transcriptional regulator [Pseudonocardiaceae bacterium]